MARESKKGSRGFNWRLWLLVVALGVAGVSTAVAGFRVRQYALTDQQFMLSRDRPDALTIQGLNYTARTKVQQVFTADFDHSIFSVPLAERRRRLLAIDWVEDASVSRIWPDRLAVRIRERQPVAFVEVESSVMLIDGQGMLLEPPPRAQFAFPVLSGVRAEDPPARRMEAVRALLDVEDALGPQMKDVSEVNAADPGNIRVVAQLDGHVVDLILGEDNLGARYRNFLDHYAEIHKRSPEVKTFDLRLDDRITAKK